MPNGTFATLHFAAEREREGRDCFVAKTIHFNITKLLRPGNIASGAQNSIKSIKFAIFSYSSFKFTHLTPGGGGGYSHKVRIGVSREGS